MKKSADKKVGGASILERPIGSDPEELRTLNPDLDIWDAYAVIHLLMPDGTMRLGGEAVAEVLRNLPNTQWLAKSFNLSILGFRPFQVGLNLAYATLAASRPLLGCESCGTPTGWMKPVRWVVNEFKACFGKRRKRIPTHHFTPISGPKKAATP